ncbi:hypothetical protein G7Y89_g2562 [Cudoniella acicularis]|uniref:Chitin-binding type-1 domain-containing protein n=1 Tax=Cudoniella acicularis TaxID=354080 RepID=A0A8H4W6U7_9HELO|nr:hypothetical protein G7Y89_g2562 [Cudoniella acicularis]
MHFSTILAALTLGSAVTAHMELSYPAPLRGKTNPHANQNTIDYSMTSPLSGASQFPCKGYQVDMADTTGVGAPTASWTAGQKYNFTVDGGATHSGGSCQASLSYDQGKTFSVIHSYIGSCPLSSGQNFDFTIPSDAKAGTAMFAWTWYNEVGNREIYMNCASVNIAAGSGTAPAVAFAQRPTIWVANLANGCTTVEGKDVIFPDPGPDADVTTTQKVTNDSGSFTGTCAAVSGVGGPAAAGSGSSGSGTSGGSATGAASSAAPVASSVAPEVSSNPVASAPTSSSAPTFTILPSPATSSAAATQPAAAPSASSEPATSTASAAAPSGTGTTGSGTATQLSTNGECGGPQTCYDSTGASQFGGCCSQWGYCGDTTLHCGTGCMSQFGQCGVNGTSTARKLIRGGLFARLGN